MPAKRQLHSCTVRRTHAKTKYCPPLRNIVLAVLKAKLKIKNPKIRTGIGSKPKNSLGKWQSGPSPGTPRAKEKIKDNFKHIQENVALRCAILFPGRKSGFRPASYRESLKHRSRNLILKFSRPETGRNPARTPDFRPGITIAYPKVLRPRPGCA